MTQSPAGVLALRCLVVAGCLTVGLGSGVARAADGPGLGNLTYTAGELFEAISVVVSPAGQGNVAMVNGYLMVIFSTDGGGTSGDGGIEFWDVSDPRSPSLHVAYDNSDTHGLREAHGFGFSNSYGADLLVAQAVDGIQFWDVTNPDAISLVHYMNLPGIAQGDYSGAWWAFWQAPYVYVAGLGQGLYVIDASDPADPVLVNQMTTSQLGGLNPATLFAVGDLLVFAQQQNSGYATLDIGDPENPTLINAYATGIQGYSHIFAGGQILTSGGNGGAISMGVHDVSDDGSQISLVGSGPTACEGTNFSNGGYGSLQDGFFMSGFSNRVAKFEIASLSLVGCGSSLIPGRDDDFATALGNLIWAGNDHVQGSALIPHQTAPDTTGPSVLKVYPADAATGVRYTTAVGVSMSDHIDIESVDTTTFIVRSVGGSALPGKYSSQMGIVNFRPDTPFLGNASYEVVVDGMRDWAGNLGGSFSSSFTTGIAPASCTLEALAPAAVGATADLDVGMVVGMQPITFSWDFGDGTPPTTPSTTSAVSHSWATPGRYGVVLTVEDSMGSSSCSTLQIVHTPVTAQPPTGSGPIVHDGVRSYNVNPDNDTVTAISNATLSVDWEVPVGDDPRSLAISPSGDVWVVSRGDAQIDVLNPATGALLATHPLPRASQPFGIAFAPDGSSAFVTLEATGRLWKLHAMTGGLAGDIDVGPNPRGIAVSGDSSFVLVTRFISEPARLLDHSNPASIVLPEGEVRVVTNNPFAVTATVPLTFDPGPDTESSGRGVPNYVASLRISPDGLRALVPSKKDNVARGEFLENQPLSFESRTRTIVSEIDLTTDSENLSARLDLDDRDMAQSVAFSPLGDLYVVALQGSNLIEVRDAVTSERLDLHVTGSAPQGLSFSPDGSSLFVHNYLSRSVSVFDTSALIEGRSNAATFVGNVSTVAFETLAPDVLDGKRIFYDASDPRMSQDGYISCASCHLDGGSDGQVWDFTQVGEGLRNTIDLRGRAGTGDGRVHWTANFDEIQDFENDIRDAFAGLGFMTSGDFIATRNPLGLPKAGLSADLDALAAYVASLDAVSPSPHRQSDGRFTSQALDGMIVFQDRDCLMCHKHFRFTDTERHDVGTDLVSSGLGSGEPLTTIGIDTPTLKGVWATPPYLHNGAAETLEDAMSSAMHGSSDLLTPTQRSDLAAYLRELEADDLPPVDRLDISGTASGGQISLTLSGVSLIVPTTLGQSASEVATALELAFAAEPLLDAEMGTAAGDSFLVSNRLTAFNVSDPGLSVNLDAGHKVPALSPVAMLLLVVCLATVGHRALSRRRLRLARSSSEFS